MVVAHTISVLRLPCSWWQSPNSTDFASDATVHIPLASPALSRITVVSRQHFQARRGSNEATARVATNSAHTGYTSLTHLVRLSNIPTALLLEGLAVATALCLR